MTNNNSKNKKHSQNTENGENPQSYDGSARLVAQYTKDLSFENPISSNLSGLQSAPTVTVNVDVKANETSDNFYEVYLNVNINAAIKNQTAYLLQLTYAGMFEINNFPKDKMGLLLLVEGPQLLFPYVRRIVSDVIIDGGFPPVQLDPINFLALYQNEIDKTKDKNLSEQKLNA